MIMNYRKIPLALMCLFLLVQISANAHDEHKKKGQDSTEVKTDSLSTFIPPQAEEKSHQEHTHTETKVTASLSDFPHLHPLVVHFPIVLLILVVAIQLANVILPKKVLDWIVSLFLVLGFVGAYLSSSLLHPHTHGLEANAIKVLEQHDVWAYRTIYLAGAALILQLIVQFRFRMRWARVIVFICVLLAGISVSVTGHYGAQLVHIEGVGPQGKFLEDGHEHSH